jgi:hypothetical protein
MESAAHVVATRAPWHGRRSLKSPLEGRIPPNWRSPLSAQAIPAPADLSGVTTMGRRAAEGALVGARLDVEVADPRAPADERRREALLAQGGPQGGDLRTNAQCPLVGRGLRRMGELLVRGWRRSSPPRLPRTRHR